jgi:tryptophanyl-tRNA synthetase
VRRCNRLYGDVLVEPRALLSATPSVPGSDGRKMSKSLDNAIDVRDDEDAIRRKVRSFVTDPQKVRLGDPGRPEICPIFSLHALFSRDIYDWTEENCRTGALGCVECKGNLADRIVTYYGPFRERRDALDETPELAETILARGEAKVRPVVEETMKAVRSAMSLG